MKVSKGTKGNVFNITESENRKNTVTANFSTYEGEDKDGNAVYSSWRTHFVGNAYEKAKSLTEKDKILLLNAKVENNYNNAFNTKYKMLFLTESEWKKQASSFDKNKKYEYINDDEYINNAGSQGLAEELFGKDINVE